MDAVRNAWPHFWFKPEPAYTLGAIRIAFGAIVVGWTLSLLPDLDDFFSSTGIVPVPSSGADQWGIFGIWPDDRAVMIGWVVLLIAAIAMMVGWHSRVASFLVFALVMSFELRCPYIFNSGDNLLRVEALLLVLAPTGAALSLDQLRSSGSFWSAQDRARWPIRLMQVQFSLIYIATFVTRMTGHKWLEGTALSYAMRLQDMLIVPAPQWLSTNALIMNVATWGVLVGELLIGILVWNRRCRPVVLVAGVILHAGIMMTIAVGFFSPAMFLLYLSFVPPDTVRRYMNRFNGALRKKVSTDDLEGVLEEKRAAEEELVQPADDDGTDRELRRHFEVVVGDVLGPRDRPPPVGQAGLEGEHHVVARHVRLDHHGGGGRPV
jgi:hypothetical protein